MDEKRDMLQNPEEVPVVPEEGADAAANEAESTIPEEINTGETKADETAVTDLAQTDAQAFVTAPSQEIMEEAVPMPAGEEKVEKQETPQPPKKKKGLIWGMVAAAIIVCGSAFAMLSGGASGPKAVVKEALANSYAQSLALNEKMQQEIPFLQQMQQIKAEPLHSDFSLVLNSLNGVEGAEMFNLLFAGASVQGSVEAMPDVSAFNLDAGLRLFGKDFIGLYLYQSPQEIAFQIPTFTDKVVGINLDTYEKDMEQSYLKNEDLDIEELVDSLEEMKTQLNAEPLSQTQIMAVSKEILDQTMALLDKGTYVEGETVDGLTEYRVTIAANDMKNYLTDVLQYILLDSPLRDIYEAEYTLAANELDENVDMDYSSDIKEMLAQIKEDIPDFETNMTFWIDADTMIKEYTIAVKQTEFPEGSLTALDNFLVTGHSEAQNSTVTVDARITEDGVPIQISLIGESSYADKIYNLQMVMDLQQEEETGKLLISALLDGTKNTDNLGFHMIVNSEDMDILAIDCNGDAYVENEQVTFNMKKLALTCNDGIEKLGIDLSAFLRYRSIEEVSKKDFINLFTMTEQEVNDLMLEYNNGIDRLFNVFMN